VKTLLSLMRVTAGLVLGWTALEAANHGGVWYSVLAALLGVLALAILAIEGLRVWGVLKYGTED
jgi:hypothetical protein